MMFLSYPTHISQRNNNPLGMATLTKALGIKQLLHSESQYTSQEYRMVTRQYQITQSMSRIGKCIDNEPIENLFGHFNTKCCAFKTYKTFEDLVTDIKSYIYF